MTLGMVPTDRLRANPANVRQDLGDLTELAASIKAQGLLQPLVVQPPRDGICTVIDGHRRLAAATLAGVPALPCLTTTASSTDQVTATMLAAALHKSLTPLEQAHAFEQLRHQGLTNADIARRTGYSHKTIASRLMLLELPTEAQQLVAAKRLTVTDATQLVRQVRATGTGRVRSSEKTGWLNGQHRLAAAAAGRCTHAETRIQLGGTACGQCWEQTIRADERGEPEAASPKGVDEVAVQRAVDGDRASRLSPRETDAAVTQLARRGYNDARIADLLGITARTVLRSRQRTGTNAAVPAHRPGARVSHLFRAIWPITDPTQPLDELAAQADLDAVARRAHAQILGRVRWSIRPGSDVPGSGGHHLVLVAEAPAAPTEREVEAA